MGMEGMILSRDGEMVWAWGGGGCVWWVTLDRGGGGGRGCVWGCDTKGKDHVSKESNFPAGRRSRGRSTPSPLLLPRYLLPTISTLCLCFNTYPCCLN